MAWRSHLLNCPLATLSVISNVISTSTFQVIPDLALIVAISKNNITMKYAFVTVALASLWSYAAAHSQLTEPQSTAPMVGVAWVASFPLSFIVLLLLTRVAILSQVQTCRLGGDPPFDGETCEGPCDLRAIKGGFANFDSRTSLQPCTPVDREFE